MNERMDEYVRLFPVHPDYIGTFERLVFTEKRGALVTLRDQIQAILNDKVPEDRPGLIGYDKFWDTVTSNSVLRADPNIGPVLKVSEVLTERVHQGVHPTGLQADGIADHRRSLGASPDDRRRHLRSRRPDRRGASRHAVPLPAGHRGHGRRSRSRSPLLVQTVLRETLKTVNGQFISKAPDTEQYYLDLKKDVDYDAQIEKRAEALSDDALDRAYYSAIRQLMERTDEASLRHWPPNLAVPDRMAGPSRRAQRLPLLRRPQRSARPPNPSGTSISISCSRSSRRGSATITSRTRCSSG